MRFAGLLALLCAVLFISPVARADGLLPTFAGRFDYTRCQNLLEAMERDGIPGQVKGIYPQISKQMPNRHMGSFFVGTTADGRPRHTILDIGTSDAGVCEGQASTTYVVGKSCAAYAGTDLKDLKHVGNLNGGPIQVYYNPPYALFLSDIKGAHHQDQCMVTGSRRYAPNDRVSTCHTGAVAGHDAKLCLLYQGFQHYRIALSVDGETVFSLKNDYAQDFSLRHPLDNSDGKARSVKVSGGCHARSNHPDSQVCTVHWGRDTLFNDVVFKLR